MAIVRRRNLIIYIHSQLENVAFRAHCYPTADPLNSLRAREHEVKMARNMPSNHTEKQDKNCGHCCDILPIQSQFKANTMEIITGISTRVTVIFGQLVFSVYWL